MERKPVSHSIKVEYQVNYSKTYATFEKFESFEKAKRFAHFCELNGAKDISLLEHIQTTISNRIYYVS